ncbi:MAG: N-formylglutamate amidohydrolase [Rhizobiaceae bacterium]|nr:N-formylglutamate amidohydrolase [Rhizobiaceae bacterium]MCV0408236.1 N-formylglutamate amidohydrolase [Rhizobiaceae bacterium]
MSEPTAKAGASPMVAIEEPRGEALPLVFDSPHSGTIYPEDFRHATTLELLRGSEDRFVDDLFADAPVAGATLVRALFARSYIDPNRSLFDIDVGLMSDDWPEAVEPSETTRRGFGLVFRLHGEAQPIYDRKLDTAEIRRRIETCWRPFHDALDETIAGLCDAHGAVWHINCHSMQPVGNELAPDPGKVRPDMVLGDLDGRSCDRAFTDFVAGALEGLGYSVALNDPYKGAYIVERHGRPDDGRHSLQIEVNRKLYMNQDDLDRHEGFAGLRRDLAQLARQVADFVREQL